MRLAKIAAGGPDAEAECLLWWRKSSPPRRPRRQDLAKQRQKRSRIFQSLPMKISNKTLSTAGRGLWKVVSTCKGAQFCTSSALTTDEFITVARL
jgi:hypothetical protein